MTTFPVVPRAAQPPAQYDAAGTVLRADPPGDRPAEHARVLLLGREHIELGTHACTSLGSSVGLALSPGAVGKSCWSLDPNEDAAFASTGSAGFLLAVADGHGGSDAAEAALSGVASVCPALDDGWSTPELVVHWAVDAAREAVTARLAQAQGSRRGSRTSLTVALVTANRAITATYGDSTVMRVRGRRLKVLASPAPFLGPRACAATVGVTPVRRKDTVILATDGLTTSLGDRLRAQVVAASGDRNPTAAVRRLVESALAHGADDDVAVIALLR